MSNFAELNKLIPYARHTTQPDIVSKDEIIHVSENPNLCSNQLGSCENLIYNEYRQGKPTEKHSPHHEKTAHHSKSAKMSSLTPGETAALLKISENLSSFDEDSKHLRAQLIKIIESNNFLTKKCSELEKDYEKLKLSEQEKIREVNSLNEIINNPKQGEVLKNSFAQLQTKFEAVKLENVQLLQHIDKLKREKGEWSRIKLSLEDELNEKNDYYEMSVIEKCVAEENVEILKADLKVAQDRIEELTLELDLADKEIEENCEGKLGIRHLKLQNDRLKDALLQYCPSN